MAILPECPPAPDIEARRPQQAAIPHAVLSRARAKRLPADWLVREFGLCGGDGPGSVRIPYKGEDGELLGWKTRNPPGSKDRFFQSKGLKSAPYRLWRIDEAREKG